MSAFALTTRRAILPGGERPATVVVRDGRIAAVFPPDAAPPDAAPPDAAPPDGLADVPVRDLGDLQLFPGFVDAHVHVNDPGRAHWEGFDTATRAAALGGVTTLVDMPLNSLPPTTSRAALDAKLAATTGRLHVDVAFWGGVVPGSEEHLDDLAAAGVRGFKAFTCDSGVPEYGSFAPERLRAVLEHTGRLGVPLIVHAEHPDHLQPVPPDADRRAYRTWLDSRPEDAEVAAITALLDAVRATGAPAHVLHLSAAAALEPLAAARAEGLPVTVETCPHYLVLAAEEVPDGAPAFKCAPPIRGRANRDALWDGLRAGVIDAVVSDHSPAPAADKHLDDGDLIAAWGGIASVQLGPSLVLDAARERGIPPADVSRWMAAAPARIAGLADVGVLAPGARADLVAIDDRVAWEVDPTALAHRHPVSPYAGRRLVHAVRHTWLRGVEVVRDGAFVAPAAGRPWLGRSLP